MFPAERCEKDDIMRRTRTIRSGITITVTILLTWILFYGGAVKAAKQASVMEQGSPDGWYAINDGVMGGISQSRAVKTDRDTLLFAGTVSLENNGGFASIRHDADAFGIGPGDGISLRVKGDGKTYQLRVRTSDRFDGVAYKAEFGTQPDVWQDIHLPWKRFAATYRGREVNGAPALQGDRIRQVGFLIAGKQEGTFKLEIESLASLASVE